MSGKPLLLSSDRADQGVWERKGMLCRGQGGIDTPLIFPLENLRFLCRPSIHYAPELFKAALNVFVAEGQTLDDPRDLTEETTA
jgi:hypothetical protein